MLAARRAGQLTTDQAIAIYFFLDAVNRLPEALAEAIDGELALTEEAPAEPATPDETAKAEKSGKGEKVKAEQANTSNAAKLLLEKYARRRRP